MLLNKVGISLSSNFQSSVTLSEEQIELMITDIRDILGRLKDKSVIDFEKEKSIMLLDSDGTLIEFKRTELTEIKRFTSLVTASIRLLEYLVRNPSSSTVVKEVERNDRIMGSPNIQKTIAINRVYSKNTTVVCNEIHKTMDTPENHVLAQILFSIVIQCNKYLLKGGKLDSGALIDNPTLDILSSLRDYTADLLSTNTIKSVLPNAIATLANFESIFKSMIERLYLGKVPSHFAGMYNILHKWKYFVWISNKNPDLIEHSLRYYFFNLTNKNQLYECWVLYKILNTLTEIFDLKLKETDRSKGEVTFGSTNNSITVTYQRIYETDWKDKEKKPVQEKPDIVIEFKGSTLILDAKNSDLSEGGYPYREQMDSYMRSAGIENTKYGIFIFSQGDQMDYREIGRMHQKILWRSLHPTNDMNKVPFNVQILDELTKIFKSLGTKAYSNRELNHV